MEGIQVKVRYRVRGGEEKTCVANCSKDATVEDVATEIAIRLRLGELECAARVDGAAVSDTDKVVREHLNFCLDHKRMAFKDDSS